MNWFNSFGYDVDEESVRSATREDPESWAMRNYPETGFEEMRGQPSSPRPRFPLADFWLFS
jgi:hypothetical protein